MLFWLLCQLFLEILQLKFLDFSRLNKKHAFLDTLPAIFGDFQGENFGVFPGNSPANFGEFSTGFPPEIVWKSTPEIFQNLCRKCSRRLPGIFSNPFFQKVLGVLPKIFKNHSQLCFKQSFHLFCALTWNNFQACFYIYLVYLLDLYGKIRIIIHKYAWKPF